MERKRTSVHLHPLTEEQLKIFDHELVELNLSFSEWVRGKIIQEIGTE